MFENVLPPASSTLLRDLDGELKSQGFYLAGGTGLALQLGHRVSEDLDFFTGGDFDPVGLSRHLEAGPEYSETMVGKGTLYCRVSGVKLSFLHYPVPLRHPPLNYLAVTVADWRDILAERFKTVSQRGSRRDFYDIYACLTLKRLSIGEAVAFLKERLAGSGINYQHIAKSLTWFADAESEPNPRLLMQADWPTVPEFFDSHADDFAASLA